MLQQLPFLHMIMMAYFIIWIFMNLIAEDMWIPNTQIKTFIFWTHIAYLDQQTALIQNLVVYFLFVLAFLALCPNWLLFYWFEILQGSLFDFIVWSHCLISNVIKFFLKAELYSENRSILQVLDFFNTSSSLIMDIQKIFTFICHVRNIALLIQY